MTDPFGILTSHIGKTVRVRVYDGPVSADLSSSTTATASDHTILRGTLVCLDDFGNLVLKDWTCQCGPRAATVHDSDDEAVAGRAVGGRPAKRSREHTVAGRLVPTSGALRFIRGSQVASIGLV